MIETSSLLLFLGTAVVLLLTPGPSVLYITVRSIEQGSRAGLVSVMGMTAGGVAHVCAAAFGLSALLMSSAAAFAVVKLAGAAYLIYLGVRTLSTAAEAASAPVPDHKPLRRIFGESVLVQLLNPKTALFFFAFLPQFVDAGRGSALVQVIILGAAFLALALVTDSAYAVGAGQIAGWLRSSPGVVRRQRYVSGVVYLALGVAAGVRS